MARLIKIALALVAVALVLVGLYFWSLKPSTDLVDASGAELTAGLPAEGGEGPSLFSGDDFTEARSMIERRQYAAARDLLIGLLETSERDGEACILLSEATRQMEEIDAAADYGLKAIELLPESSEAHHTYSKALALKMMKGGNPMEAMVLLPKWKEEIAIAVELDPSNVDAHLEQIAFYLYVPGFLGGDVDRGIELCQELETENPARGKLWLALAHQAAEDLERAKEICEEGAAQFPDDRLFPAILGTFYAKEERYEEADQCFERARQGARDEAYYRALFSQAQMRIDGEFEQERAVELLDEFAKSNLEVPLMPTVAMALMQKGKAYEQLERPADARSAYEECLRVEPGFAPAEEALQALDE